MGSDVQPTQSSNRTSRAGSLPKRNSCASLMISFHASWYSLMISPANPLAGACGGETEDHLGGNRNRNGIFLGCDARGGETKDLFLGRGGTTTGLFLGRGGTTTGLFLGRGGTTTGLFLGCCGTWTLRGARGGETKGLFLGCVKATFGSASGAG